MHRRVEFTILLVGLLILGTGMMQPVEAGSAVRALNKALSVRSQMVSETIKPPDGTNPDAIPADVTISYPELVSFNGTDPVAEEINRAIQKRLLAAGTVNGDGFASKEELIDNFRTRYQQAMKEDTAMIGAWFLKFEAVIRYADEELLCLDIMDSSFIGGAHPDSLVTYQVFSLQTGLPLALTTFVPADKADELVKVAEKNFRVLRELKSEQSLADAGYQFADNRFALNTNFLVTRDGLVFYYNPYEIAPYGMGNTELLVPWAELKTIADPTGPAKKFF